MAHQTKPARSLARPAAKAGTPPPTRRRGRPEPPAERPLPRRRRSRSSLAQAAARAAELAALDEHERVEFARIAEIEAEREDPEAVRLGHAMRRLWTNPVRRQHPRTWMEMLLQATFVGDLRAAGDPYAGTRGRTFDYQGLRQRTKANRLMRVKARSRARKSARRAPPPDAATDQSAP